MSIKRQLSIALLVGVGSTLVGCKTPAGSGLAFWKSDDTSLASSAPDTGRQKYENLAKEFGSSGTPSGGIGSQPKAPDQGPVVSSWNKATAAIAGAFTTKPKVVTDDPTSLASKSGKMGPDVYVRLGQMYEGQNKPTEAIAQYQKALAASPNHLEAMVSLARLHDRRGESAQAVEIYQKALKAHPKSALVHNDLGLCYARQKQYQRATESLNKAIALQPGNPKYRNNLATVMVELGRPDDAYQQLAAVNSEAIAHFNLAYLLHERGQTGPAVLHLQQAVSRDPSLAPAQEMLAALTGQAPTGAPQGESRVAALPASAPIYRQPSDVSWQPTPAVQSPTPSTQYNPSPYATLPNDQAAPTPAGTGGAYHIGDDIGPIQANQTGGQRDSASAATTGVEPLPPIEG